MTDPHLEPFSMERYADTKYTRIYLTSSSTTKDYALHIKLRSDFGMHESETLDAEFFDLQFSSECSLNGARECFWMGLGKKETAASEAVINETFKRFSEHIDRLLVTAWDYRCALENLRCSSADF
jgi:hypothetical protein